MNYEHEPVFTISEVAEIVRVHPTTIWRKASRDYRRGDERVLRIPPDSPRGVFRVKKSWLDDFFRRRR